MRPHFRAGDAAARAFPPERPGKPALPGGIAADADAAAVRELIESGRDDPIAAGDPGRDHRLVFVLLSDGHRAHGDLAVVADHEHEWSVGSALDRGGRHHDHLVQRVDQDPHVDKLPGPQLQVFIGKLGFQLERAGCLIDLIVDHLEAAVIDDAFVILPERVDLDLAGGERLCDLRELLLRQGEDDRDRPQLCEHNDRRSVRALHDIANVDLADAGAPRDRGNDLGPGQIGALIIDSGLVRFHLGFELRDQRLLGVRLLLRAGIGLGQVDVADQIYSGIGERRFILRFFGDRLVILGLIDRRVDLRQHEALLDVLSFLEKDIDQLSVDLRADRDGVERLHDADTVEIDRHVRRAGRGGQRRDRLIGLALKPAAALWGVLGRPHHNCCDRSGDDQNHQTGDDAPA